jgi:hypothetical protein
MGKKKKQPGGGRVTPKGTQPPQTKRGPSPRDDDDAWIEVRRALREPGPAALLDFASTVVGLASEPDHEFDELDDETDGEGPDLDLGLLVAALHADARRETTALLAALRLIGPDDLDLAPVEAALATRTFDGLPGWVASLAEVEVTGTWVARHVLGDAEELLVGLRWPTGDACTVALLVGHNDGVVAQDGFVMHLGIEEALDDLRRVAADEVGTTVAPIDAALARAIADAAIELGELTVPAYETETWPACRALASWAFGLLPEGGERPEPREWTDEERDEVVDALLASPEAAAASLDAGHHDIAHALVSYATDFGPGDPLVWSAERVVIVLLDFVPAQVVAPAGDLETVPDVLRALVRHGHRVRGIADVFTDQALAAVDDTEAEYQDWIADSGPERALAIAQAALLLGDVRVAEGGADDLDLDDVDDLDPPYVDLPPIP